MGAIGLLLGMIAVLAFPPSPLFISELKILSQTVIAGDWWLTIAITVIMCIVIYSVCQRFVKLCYQSNQDERHLSKLNRRLSYSALSLLLVALVLGLWQPDFLLTLIDNIATL